MVTPCDRWPAALEEHILQAPQSPNGRPTEIMCLQTGTAAAGGLDAWHPDHVLCCAVLCCAVHKLYSM